MKRAWLQLSVLWCLICVGSGSPFAQPAPQQYDVVVIGAGGGGLAAAARLARAGKKVLVLEQHSKVGGYMTNFQRGDYTFEVSLHAMDGLDEPGGMNRAGFRALGILDKVQPVKLDPMYRAVFPDFTIDVPAEAAAYQALLQEKFPEEAEGIAALFANQRTINRAMQAMIGLAGEERGKSLREILFHPWIFWPVIKYWNATLSEMLDDFIHDPKLIAVFTQLSGFAGAEPNRVSALFFSVMWNSYHLGGYYYFVGGSQSVSNALAEVIQENGGEIKLNTLVTKIVLEGKRAVAVQTRDGAEYPCRFVVSNANAPDTFFKLIGREHLPADYVQKLENLQIGLSAFQVFLGVDHDFRDLFPRSHDLMINVTYDQAENFGYYTRGEPDQVPFAIVNYSVVDPTAAPPGKNVICLTSIMPYDWQDGWHEQESYARYQALKEEVAWTLIRRAEAFVPGLSQRIEVLEVGSPRTMEHYTLNPQGTIFGWDNTPEQSMMKRLPQETPIENLYLAGAWTFPGGGQSAVLSSGLMAAEKILARDQ